MLLTVALFASSDRASATRESKLRPANGPIRLLVNAPTKRLLRAYSTDEEERGMPVNISGLEKISKAFTSSKTKELKADDLGNAFKALKLSTMPIGKNGFIETNMVVTRNFKVWSEHAAELNKQDPEGAMLTALTKVFGEKEVAIMILLGKHSWSSSGAAKKLETALFNKWYTIDKYRTADDAFTNVLKADRNTIHKYAREKAIWGDFSTYITNRVMKY
ncbi:hypothetical protein GQ600_114 [Phytophthora cactorum]|nr:hypothetical protein GQ600_114 [Phytophthora cactorum]